jgi:DNA invertase Pin-like site-specific DNA recombinase
MMSDHLTKEADRLKNDPIFQKALDDIRADEIEALVVANVDDKTAILRHQQMVLAIDEIRNVLDRYIIAADVQEQPGSFA